MTVITEDVCPRCATGLTRLTDEEPWCGACEWNLDTFPVPDSATWVWRRIIAKDKAAGFASDRLLATSAQNAEVRTAYRWLVSVSAALVVVVLGVAGAGIYLLIGGALLVTKFLGLLLVALAVVIRPRLYPRLKTTLADVSFVLEPRHAPELHRLIGQVAAQIGAPPPDILAIGYSWEAWTTVAGLRRKKVLYLGIPLLLAIQPAELVALLGHELGHLKHEDTKRRILTYPALSTFGRLSRMVRPPQVNPARLGLGAVPYLAWKLAGGALSLLLWWIHAGLNVVGSRDRRRVELRADAMAVQAAGSAAATDMIDVAASVLMLSGYVQHHVPKGEAADSWRRFLLTVREREADGMPMRRQLSIRREASLFASHPAPGRRHQWMTSQPPREPAIRVDETAAKRIESEIKPYAEKMHQRMLDNVLG
jgi:heat shock protein HtpX